MIVKVLKKEDQKAVKKLWGYAFETDEPFYSWYFDEVFDPSNAVGIFIHDELVSCLQLNPYILNVHESLLPTSYVVGVITKPEYRSKGLMKILLPKALEIMNHKNHSISILMPFDTTFYKKYGWELCYSQKLYRLPISIVKSLAHPYEDVQFIPIDLSRDSKDLSDIYEYYLRNHTGYIQRNNRNWYFIYKDLISYNGYAYILRKGSKPIGYIFYILKQNTFKVTEMAYTSYEAYKSLFSFIYQHLSQVSFVEFHTPLNDPTHLFLKDTIKPTPTNDIRIHPFMCARIVNVKEAFESSYFSVMNDSFSFHINVEDPYAKWNHRTFRILMKNHKAYVTASKDKPDLSVPINTLTQLFLGALTLEEALFFKQATLYNKHLFTPLSKLFSKKENYILEYF